MVSPPAPPASTTLATTTKASMVEWRNDLQKLFERAKERFPDVVWELGDDPDKVEEIWGHKGMRAYRIQWFFLLFLTTCCAF